MAVAVNSALANLTNEIREGAKISAIYLEYWISSNDAAQGSALVTLEKIQADAPDMTFANHQALYSYKNKKNILYTFMGLVNPNVGVAMPIVRGWFKIPKSKQRFGLGDQLVVNYSGISSAINVCGFCIFKEQY